MNLLDKCLEEDIGLQRRMELTKNQGQASLRRNLKATKMGELELPARIPRTPKTRKSEMIWGKDYVSSKH